MAFGEHIKRVRNQNKITMREVERRTGISQAYLSQIESGKRNTPKPEIIKKLAKGLEVSYTQLLEEAGYLEEGSYERIKKTTRAFAEHNRKISEHSEKQGEEINPEKFPNPFIFQKKINLPQKYKVDNEERTTENSDVLDLYYYISMGIDKNDLINLTYKGKPIDKEKLAKVLELLRITIE